ncbi:MAG: YciI family protein [Pseudomonadota bacterium]
MQWDTYRGEVRARGALGLEMFVVESRPAGDLAAVKASLHDHLGYQKTCESNGSLFLAGPLSDESGTQAAGSGMIIYRASSLEAARALAEADPMHRSGARTFTLRRWLVNEGRLSLDLHLSSQSLAVT